MPYVETHPVPSPFRKSPPWIMKSFMMRWNVVFLYPIGVRSRWFLCSPVQNLRKFSAVLGQTSAQSSIVTLPTAAPPIVTSKNTTGFWGFVCLWCHGSVDIFCWGKHVERRGLADLAGARARDDSAENFLGGLKKIFF